ncbi:hypothetical protein M404DRAFT_32479 [Pisolithus tinctorius Marx 270]|uniref:Uncharacterized protein n=1 Tax=Pisolithus tinctorius Marx 270 TaxID=870435 RepID=A0A0C3N890_PISTI|nr:hypothetical protein M404DRAFT_32479 [Pisolithus tinctorius Marx 270]
MLLLLTELTLFWLNLTWNVSALNNRTLLAGHVKSWASGVAPVGNGTPHNSVTLGSQVQTDGMPNLPPSTVPSLTTKATSISSEISVTEDDQECTMPQESTECHMISNDVPAAAHNEDEHYFRDPLTVSAKFTQYQKPVEAMACATNTSADAKSDLKVENPISHAVQAGLKRRHTNHDNVEYVSSSEVENADDGGSFCDLHDVNVCMKVVKEPCVTTMTNIRIDKLAKKAKGVGLSKFHIRSATFDGDQQHDLQAHMFHQCKLA